MKRRLLIAALVLFVTGLGWWLVRVETPAPLAVSFLHRTNNSLGQVRYLIAVTNLSSHGAVVEFNGRSHFPFGVVMGGGDDTFTNLEMDSGSGLVVAWERTNMQARQAVVRYRTRNRLTEWKEWLQEKISPGSYRAQDLDSNSPAIFIDLPPD